MIPRMRVLAAALALSSIFTVAAPAAGEKAAYPFLLGSLLANEGDYATAIDSLREAVASEPDDPYLRVQLAQWLLRLGRSDEASSEARKAAELLPGDPDVMRVLARVETARADRDTAARDRARDAYEKLLAADADDVEALVSLGQIYLAEENFERAVQVLEPAHHLRPDQGMIESLLLQAYDRAGRWESAETLQRQDLLASPFDIGKRVGLAEALSRQGKHEEAVAVLRDTPGDQASSTEIRRRLSWELYRTGDLDGARQHAAALLADEPTLSSARYLRALIELADGRPQLAEADLADLARQAPQNEQVAGLLVDALERQGRIDDAMQVYARLAQALQPDDAKTAGRQAELAAIGVLARAERWSDMAARAAKLAGSDDPELALRGQLLLADAKRGLGDFDGALAALGGASERRPEVAGERLDVLIAAGREAEAATTAEELASSTTDGAVRVAQSYLRHDRYAAALPWLDRALAADPQSVDLRFLRASALERSGKADEAVELLRGLVDQQPDLAPALNYLGYLWIDRGDHLEDGVRMVRRALTLDPANGAYADSVGWGEFKAGRTAVAIDYLERASRLMPRDATVLEHLGDAYGATGDKAKARDAYRRAQAAHPEDAATLERKLRDLGGDS
jgi:Flp pilus assembly protein TadD